MKLGMILQHDDHVLETFQHKDTWQYLPAKCGRIISLKLSGYNM